MIRFHNTLSGQSEEFVPLEPPKVGMYTCGPTVYDYAHIGNFRAFVFEDLLRRFLESQGYRVNHVMNLTDVDDKTIAGSQRQKATLEDFTEIYIRAFQEDLACLRILAPNCPGEQPRATREIPAMIELIGTLIAKGAAYESEGSVYYRVGSFPSYGKLSKKKLEGNIAGARVDVDEYDKEQGADFVLWKKWKEGEPWWDSPWGRGRPGWHIECSAMSMRYLGETFDIHAGGEDLVFPHHENEIAQSEAATGKPFVRYWLHCKFLLVDGEKMSKSKGNFYTLRDLLGKGFDPAAIRYLLLSTHYRTPLNFTLKGLREASETVKRLDDCYWQCINRCREENQEEPAQALYDPFYRKMTEALSDDLNISEALAALSEAVKTINSEMAQAAPVSAAFAALDFFEKIDALLGFDISAVREIPGMVLEIVNEREAVRAREDFKSNEVLQRHSDSLRREIEGLGWFVKDGRPGQPSTVKKKRR